jgi:hypothetical protein
VSPPFELTRRFEVPQTTKPAILSRVPFLEKPKFTPLPYFIYFHYSLGVTLNGIQRVVYPYTQSNINMRGGVNE